MFYNLKAWFQGVSQLPMNVFFNFQALDRAHFLPEIGTGKEVLTQYQQLCMALDEYIRKTFHEWTLTIDKVGGIGFHVSLIAQYLIKKFGLVWGESVCEYVMMVLLWNCVWL